MEERNKTLVLEAFSTLFNKQDYEAALPFVPAAAMSPFGRFCCRNRHADGAGRRVHFLKPSIVTRGMVRATYARLY